MRVDSHGVSRSTYEIGSVGTGLVRLASNALRLLIHTVRMCLAVLRSHAPNEHSRLAASLRKGSECDSKITIRLTISLCGRCRRTTANRIQYIHMERSSSVSRATISPS